MKRLLVGGAVLALGITGTGLAQAESGFKVTGGGQALASADSSSVQGPGDTYGFNAQSVEGGAPDAAKGQFNSIQRDVDATTARGKPEEHVKGAVTCLRAITAPSDDSEGTARFGGIVRGTEGNDEPTFFVVDVTDDGEGGDSDDLIVFRTFEDEPDTNPCENDETHNEEINLARGNVQIHNYPTA